MAEIKILFGSNNEDGSKVEVDKRYIDTLSSISQTTSDPSSINYGSLENSGNVVIYDRNGRIKDLIDEGVIQTEGTPIEIVLNGKTIQHHISTDNTYDKNTKQLTMSLSNKLKNWDILRYKGFPYPKGTVEEAKRTAYDVLFDVMNSLHGGLWEDYSIFDEMLSDFVIWGKDNYKTTIKEYLKSVTIEYPFIEANRTYRDVIDEFCNILQLQVYATQDDKIKFVSARPVMDFKEADIVHIPLSRVFSAIDETILPKNKYDGVEVVEANVENRVNINAPIFTYIEDVFPVWTSVDVAETVTYDSPSTLVEKKEDRVARVDSYYYDGSFYFPKRENLGLVNVLNVNIEKIGEDDVLTQHIEQSKSFELKDVTVAYSFENKTKSEIYKEATNKSKEFNIDIIEKIEPKLKEVKTTAPSADINYKGYSASISLPDETRFSFEEQEDGYICNYHVLCGIVEVSFVDTSLTSLDGSGTGEVTNVSFKKLLANKLKITVYGNKEEISFKTPEIKPNNSLQRNNTKSFPLMNLLQTNTTYDDGVKVSDSIKETILSDYSNGVPDAKLKISCSDYYDNKGEKIVSLSNGETIQPETLISVEGDFDKNGNQRVWRVTGSKFIYDDGPMLELDVTSVNKVITSLSSGLYKASTKELLYSWKELIDIGDITVEENGIRIDIINNDGILVLPNNATSISFIRVGSRLFGLHIPSSFVGSFTPFSNLYILEEIKVAKGNAVYDDSGKYNALINKPSNILVLATRNTDLDVLSHVDFIAESAFSGCIKQQKTVVIPNNIQQIQMHAFANCSFENFVFGYGNSTIYQSTLSNCQNLKSVFIPNNIKRIYCPSVYDSPFLYSNKNATIYCEAETKPSGWGSFWNYYDENTQLNVKYGYSLDEYKREVGI